MSKPSQPIIQNVISALMELDLTITDLDFRYQQEYERNKDGEWVFHCYHTFLDIEVRDKREDKLNMSRNSGTAGLHEFKNVIGTHPIAGTINQARLQQVVGAWDMLGERATLNFRIY